MVDKGDVDLHDLGSGGAAFTTLADLLDLNPVQTALPPPHCIVELSAAAAAPPTFVLEFTDLSYSVRHPSRGRSWLSRRNSVAAAESAPPVGSTSSPQEPGTKTKKKLLDSISGLARDGEILAILGPSGSGKSTLIDALAGRISTDSLSGSVTLNGEHLSGNGGVLLRSISAYVMQDDLLFPMLTVEETLTFAAELRLPRALSPAIKRSRVEALIEQLGLRSAANTIIGDEGHRGVSGGERRRVSIGVDIVHDPIVLFLDEPTSGLDSTSAFMVVKVLRRVAESGGVVVTSIHQPSARILGLLNNIIFLSGGRTVYSGPPAELSGFFAMFGRPVPKGENLAEFTLDFLRELEGSSGGSAPLVEFSKSWIDSQSRGGGGANAGYPSLKEAIASSVSKGKLAGAGDGTETVVAAAEGMGIGYANTFLGEMAVLMRRSVTNSRRMPEVAAARMASVVLTGFVYATIFWRLDESPKGVQERLGFFAIGMATMFYNCSEALPLFLQERYIFLRETAYNAYRRSSYVLANAILSFPPLVIFSVVFAVITFFTVGLAGGVDGFVFYFLIILASFWAGNSFVTFLSGVVTNLVVGYTVVVTLLAYYLLFSGFFINRDRIRNYWIWFHYISIVKYPYEAVLHNEFGGDPTRCFARGTQLFESTPLARLPAETQAQVLGAIGAALGTPGGVSGDTCVTTGADVLKQQAVTQLDKWNCLLVTVAWGFLFRIFFYLALLLGGKNKRR